MAPTTAPRLLPSAADQQRELDVEGEQRNEDVGRDVGGVVPVERAGEPERRAAERERLHLEQR